MLMNIFTLFKKLLTKQREIVTCILLLMPLLAMAGGSFQINVYSRLTLQTNQNAIKYRWSVKGGAYIQYEGGGGSGDNYYTFMALSTTPKNQQVEITCELFEREAGYDVVFDTEYFYITIVENGGDPGGGGGASYVDLEFTSDPVSHSHNVPIDAQVKFKIPKIVFENPAAPLKPVFFSSNDMLTKYEFYYDYTDNSTTVVLTHINSAGKQENLAENTFYLVTIPQYFLFTLEGQIQKNHLVIYITTGAEMSNINDVRSEIPKDVPIYNISGERLKVPKRGINIVGGKKVLLK